MSFMGFKTRLNRLHLRFPLSGITVKYHTLPETFGRRYLDTPPKKCSHSDDLDSRAQKQ